MKILIAEDDYASRKSISRFLQKYGDVDITVDGMEVVKAYRYALEDEEYYDLVCLDVMMPQMDGIQALRIIRDMEKEAGLPKERCAKVIMTTAINDAEQVREAFAYGCEGYAAKPIDFDAFVKVLEKMGLVS